jgi:hypothetical protein
LVSGCCSNSLETVGGAGILAGVVIFNPLPPRMYPGDMRLPGLLLAAGVLWADPRCLPCHSQQVESYLNTGMGRSIGIPAAEAIARQQFTHKTSGTRLLAEWRSGTLVHSLTRNGRESAYSPAWAIGSGNAGKSYLIAIGDALFQSPVSWYTARRTWDLSPGFQNDARPDFYRPVTEDCLFCHTGTARPRVGTLNRYLSPPFDPAAIGCDRCHGDPISHLKTATRATIINPARLNKDRRDAVCEQCHLSGEARIPNAGRKFSDFRPGMALERIFSVYVNNADGDPKGLKVVSHPEQMVRSRCFLESKGAMWCGTCHDPHQRPAAKAAWYREKCLQCHESKQTALHQRKAGPDCAGCHMPETNAYDGGHTAFHDHWIRLDRAEPPGKTSGRLRAWREPDAASRNRNLGLAYISVASRTGDAGHLSRGFELLSGDQPDGAVHTARGFVLLRSGKTKQAVDGFRRAVDEQPADSTRRLNLAAALLAAGDRAQAKIHAEQAITLEPLLEDAYALLAGIEPARAKYWKDRYRKLFPNRLDE